MRFSELTDDQWALIEPLLPPREKRRGKPRADDRRTVNAMPYVLITGCRWIDLPSRFGDEVTAWRRLRRWEEEGVWRCVMDALVSRGYSSGVVDMGVLSIDSSTVPAKKGETW
jgi:transposase